MKKTVFLAAVFLLLNGPLTVCFAETGTSGVAVADFSADTNAPQGNDQVAAANAVNNQAERIPQSWNLAFWGFVIAVVILSFSTKGARKPNP